MCVWTMFAMFKYNTAFPVDTHALFTYLEVCELMTNFLFGHLHRPGNVLIKLHDDKTFRARMCDAGTAAAVSSYFTHLGYNVSF